MPYILILNSGSSSLKAKVFEERNLTEKISAQVERVGLARSFLVYRQGRKNIKVNFPSGIKDHHYALKEIVKVLPDSIYRQIALVGHRIVHGGEEFVEPVVLNKKVIREIGRYNIFAPVHNPANLKTALGAMMEFPRVKQVGIFDTQFFKNLAEHVYLYSLPVKYYELYGLRKYGFHGLSHENMLNAAQSKLGRKNIKAITCHLGNGVSITAIKDGKVLDTSMGLTPLQGAMMGTRSGDLDPFIPLYLINELKMSVEEVYRELNFFSGLKGICGAADFRDVLTLAGIKVAGYQAKLKRSARRKELAKLAIKMYVYSVQKYLAGYAGLLGPVDALAFSGGIGEHRREIVEAIVKGVHFVSQPKVLIVPANEELLIAKKIKELG